MEGDAAEVMMTRIDVDYNERDEEGRVIAGVSADQLATLREGQAVTLYDPIDHLWADATVAWIQADANAAGFEVDWASFEDGDLPEAEPLRNAAITSQLTLRISMVLEPTGPGAPARPKRELAAAVGPIGDESLYSPLHRMLSFLDRIVRLRHARAPSMRAYSILPLSREQGRAVSSSGVTDLSAGWELQR
jgi:hypothetical protein